MPDPKAPTPKPMAPLPSVPKADAPIPAPKPTLEQRVANLEKAVWGTSN